MTKRRFTRHSVSFALERKVFLGVGAVIAGLVFVYVYFVGISIFYAAEREEFSIRTQKLSEEVAKLEAIYLSRSNALTEGTAAERGFVVVSTPTYVTRGSFSLNNSR